MPSFPIPKPTINPNACCIQRTTFQPSLGDMRQRSEATTTQFHISVINTGGPLRRLVAAIVLNVVASGLLGAWCKAVADGILLDVVGGEQRQSLGGAHVRDVLLEALGEDKVDLFERAKAGFGVEEVTSGLLVL